MNIQFYLSALVSALIVMGSAPSSLADQKGCEQIDRTKLDFDGMPFCPSIVQTSGMDAYSVYTCALNQAKKFHSPTRAEITATREMLTAFKKSTVEGISQENTQTLLAKADFLGLQACRVKQTRDNQIDSYLLVYTKPGVKDYSGAFFMLRETAASKVVVIGPHDDTDGTFASTKFALSRTNALATISNGHRRGALEGRRGDFVHEIDNLGTVAVAQFGQLFPNSVVLHIHGMANPKKVLYRSRSKALARSFQAGFTGTRIGPDDFANFNAYFTIDSRVHTNLYIKTEIPAVMHRNNRMIVAKVIKEIEKNNYAWPESGPEDLPNDDHEDDTVDNLEAGHSSQDLR